MRFFHLSDLHLGIKLYEHDLLKDQKAILDEIVALTRQYQPDAVVFAGDIYDRSVPPVEAVALFDDFMTQLRAALPNGEIMLISGNHDSAQRLDVFRSELSDRGIHMIGNPPMQKGERFRCGEFLPAAVRAAGHGAPCDRDEGERRQFELSRSIFASAGAVAAEP